MESFEDHQFPPITELSKRQRRVLGVLVEKAFTTPEYYPLTLKAATNGCNQKSNRAPVSNYSEDDVEETLDQLREMGLVSVVHTDGGRAARYRHWMRKRFTLSEPQLAILTELLLRGRQSLGELRTRSSRMVAIDSLETLRDELAGLQEMKLLQAGGSLQRRGVEVDHNLYRDNEGMTITASADDEADEPTTAARAPSSSPATATPAPTPVADNRLTELENNLAEFSEQNRELTEEVSSLRATVEQLQADIDRLKMELGV